MNGILFKRFFWQFLDKYYEPAGEEGKIYEWHTLFNFEWRFTKPYNYKLLL